MGQRQLGEWQDPRQQGSSKGKPAGFSLRLNSGQWSGLVFGAWKMLRKIRPQTSHWKSRGQDGRVGWERIKGKSTALLII